MLRKRYNFQKGTLTSGISASDTTIDSAELAALPAVTGSDYLAVTIDSEVLWVTAHAAASTSATVARGKEGSTAGTHASGATWRHVPTAGDFPTSRSTPGPDGATRASTTLGPLSTAWTVTLPVTEGQVVDLSALVAMMCTNDANAYVALRRGSTTIYENGHYGPVPQTVPILRTHVWRDDTPGTGDVTYEVYVASDLGTVTLKNGATLDTTKEVAQGKSLLVATAHMP